MHGISVIIPVYNAENTLHKCLDSIQAQTYHDFKVILINDGSKDKSREICETYCEKDERFKLINQENAGPAKARNRGIDEADSKYLAFVDSDDYIEPDMFEKLYTAAEVSFADITICGYYVENEDGSMRKCSFKYHPGIYHGAELKKIALEAIDIGVSGNIPPYSSIRLVKRECMENPRLRFNPDIYRSEDYLIWNSLFSKIQCLCLITDEHLYHYVQNDCSITHRYIKNYWDMAKSIYNELTNMYQQNEKAQERLNIMLMRRACIALTIATRAENKKILYTDLKKVLSDKTLRKAVKEIPFKVGSKREKARFILFKFHLYLIIRLVFILKYKENHK